MTVKFCRTWSGHADLHPCIEYVINTERQWSQLRPSSARAMRQSGTLSGRQWRRQIHQRVFYFLSFLSIYLGAHLIRKFVYDAVVSTPVAITPYDLDLEQLWRADCWKSTRSLRTVQSNSSKLGYVTCVTQFLDEHDAFCQRFLIPTWKIGGLLKSGNTGDQGYPGKESCFCPCIPNTLSMKSSD